MLTLAAGGVERRAVVQAGMNDILLHGPKCRRWFVFMRAREFGDFAGEMQLHCGVAYGCVRSAVVLVNIL